MVAAAFTGLAGNPNPAIVFPVAGTGGTSVQVIATPASGGCGQGAGLVAMVLLAFLLLACRRP